MTSFAYPVKLNPEDLRQAILRAFQTITTATELGTPVVMITRADLSLLTAAASLWTSPSEQKP